MDEAIGRGATLPGTVLGPPAGALLVPDTARSTVAVEAPAGAHAARRATSHKAWLSAFDLYGGSTDVLSLGGPV